MHLNYKHVTKLCKMGQKEGGVKSGGVKSGGATC